jgi:tRNA threonylcarbamoyl adenosine modification protein YeaZ
MKILVIDTALLAISACVLDDCADSPEAIETIALERGHAEALLPLIDRVMVRVEGGFASLGRVAVTVGPGSFTGLRVGIAAARAIGIACKVPVAGVSTDRTEGPSWRLGSRRRARPCARLARVRCGSPDRARRCSQARL